DIKKDMIIEVGNAIDIATEQLQKDLEIQSNIAKKFGEELFYFQKQKQNVLYEIKLKKYRDEIIELKKKNKCLVEIIMRLFFMNSVKRVIITEKIKEIIGGMSKEEFDKLIKGSKQSKKKDRIYQQKSNETGEEFNKRIIAEEKLNKMQ
ncbi:hypothetical protein LCGC14_3017240, partial [marine sediment metagenome]